MLALIVLLAYAGLFVAAAALCGADSRDGNDWRIDRPA